MERKLKHFNIAILNVILKRFKIFGAKNQIFQHCNFECNTKDLWFSTPKIVENNFVITRAFSVLFFSSTVRITSLIDVILVGPIFDISPPAISSSSRSFSEGVSMDTKSIQYSLQVFLASNQSTLSSAWASTSPE